MIHTIISILYPQGVTLFLFKAPLGDGGGWGGGVISFSNFTFSLLAKTEQLKASVEKGR